HPFGEVLGGVIRCTGVALDRRDAQRRPEAVAQRRSEQPDAAVEIEVRGAGVEERLIHRLLHRARQRLRGRAMHLPEAANVEPELAVADSLHDGLLPPALPPALLWGGTRRGLREYPGVAARWRDHVDHRLAGERLGQRCDRGE